MYRALPVSRQVAFQSGRGAVRVVRRRLATTPAAPTPKKKGVVRKILFYTAAATGTFYVGSVFVAFNSQRYYDFFNETIPLGQPTLEYAETHDWDELSMDSFVHTGIEAFANTSDFFSKLFGSTGTSKETSAKQNEKVQASKSTVTDKPIESRLKSVTTTLKTKVEKNEEEIVEQGKKAAAIARHQAAQFSEGVEELIRQAEAALAGHHTEAPTASEPATKDAGPIPVTNSPSPTNTSNKVYDGPLPLGHEPPFGFSRPAPPKPDVTPHPSVEADAGPEALPLVAPAIADLGVSEPVIAHLASTIDTLASYLDSNPTAAEKAKDILETAKVDLTGLASRIEAIKGEEKQQLEETLNNQAREYTAKLLELEMEAQDKLDSQEEGFRKFFDEERSKLVEGYRAKLDLELQTQTELINERLKEEVIAQGIELQRRWIREIKVRVEQERGGRLAKLDELAAHLKRLERVALDNSSYLDENIRIHALWSAFRALNSAVEAPVRKPFREELRVLRHIAAAKEDPVVMSALESLEASDVPDVGVEPFADLATWFTTSVAPRVSSVALVPDQDAGVLSHLASHLFSSFRFQRHGLVAGSDILSVLARAEYYMNEKDLDSAARELNQLKGSAKVLLADWLGAARRRLEVLQALEVVHSQATLASLLVV
jgi:mitofilin